MVAFFLGVVVGALGLLLIAAVVEMLGCAHDATVMLRGLEAVGGGTVVMSLWWCRKCHREWAEHDDGTGAASRNVTYVLGLLTESSREEWVAKKAAHAAAGKVAAR